MRFGRFVIVFMLLVIAAWILYRILSYIIRWLYEQFEDETRDWVVWIKRKSPKIKRNKKIIKVDVSHLDDEQIDRIRDILKDV